MKETIILDTDIGGDIDDTWALALAIAEPKIDLKMVMVSTGDVAYRARLVAGMLTRAGRTDVAIAIGRNTDWHQDHWLESWEGNVELADYPGPVYQDGIAALKDLIEHSEPPVRVVTIVAPTSIAECIRRFPGIEKKMTVTTMMGCIACIEKDGQVGAELNAKADVAATRLMLKKAKEVTMIPVDVCGDIVLKGEAYQTLLQSKSVFAKMVIENYRLWERETKNKVNPDLASSTLFDSVAIYSAIQGEGLAYEDLCLQVSDEGRTLKSAGGFESRVATRWEDRRPFMNWLIQTLCR